MTLTDGYINRVKSSQNKSFNSERIGSVSYELPPGLNIDEVWQTAMEHQGHMLYKILLTGVSN